MYLVITASVIAVLFTFLESKGMFRNGMNWGFALIAILGAIHYNYGNDYMDYYNLAKTIYNSPFNLKSIIAGDFYRDTGWVLLTYAFKPIGGFFTMIAVLNFFQNAIVYNIIRNEVPCGWWAMAVFIYLFVSSFYLLSFTMMRQELVMIIFLGIWPWIKKRRVILCAIILLLVTTIHSSAIVLIPFAFWGYLPTNNRILMAVVYTVVTLLLWLNNELLYMVFEEGTSFDVFDDYMNNYGDRVRSEQEISLRPGFFLGLIPLFVCLYYVLREENAASKEKVGLVWLAMIGALTTPFTIIFPLMGRVGMYFTVFNILALPITYSTIKNNVIKYSFLAIYIVLTLYNYFGFFQHPIWHDNYTTFHSIFEVI